MGLHPVLQTEVSASLVPISSKLKLRVFELPFFSQSIRPFVRGTSCSQYNLKSFNVVRRVWSRRRIG